jgi:leucyl/phenylalanyl-tRNA---protein transferase
MALTWLTTSAESCFPPVENTRDDGLLAAGGDLSSQRLLDAYQQGIFPWFNQHDPILWWSPDPRMVLFTDQVKISRSLKKTLRDTTITVTADTAFNEVITACAAPRDNHASDLENSTWIHPDMINAYIELHQQGFAHSIECWHEGQLVGGLYGIAIGQMFFGESMFSIMRDSSKIALVTLCQQLKQWGYPMIDCQINSNHLASMGAKEINRNDFIGYLNKYCLVNSPNGPWQLDAELPLSL